MKKVFFVLAVGLVVSCASVQDRIMTPQERAEAEVVGTVTTSWTSFSFLHIPPSKDSLKTKALSELRKEAVTRGFTGNFDIRNISVTQTASPFTIALFQLNIFMDIRKNMASGDVVMYNTASGRNRTFQQTVEGALDRAAEQALKNVSQKSRIAIVYITAQDRGTTEYIVGELEYIWVNQGYFITDRSQLDRLRREQNFQMSGEVDDATAVSIGKFAGADIIVTGRVDGEGNLRRLRLRALNTQTAQVVGVSSERL